jgi:hypothetical protein
MASISSINHPVGVRQARRLRRQWVIAPAATDRATSSKRELGSGLALFHHPETLIHQRRDDQAILTLLGVACSSDPAVDPAGLPLSRESLEQALASLVGAYVVILATADAAFLYTDPAGLMNVFTDEDGRVASTPALLPAAQARRDAAQRAFLTTGDDWMVGVTTPFPGVRAVLANHRLDLGSGESRRVWPREPFEATDVIAASRGAVDAVSFAAHSLQACHRPLVSITGGLDSRATLAAFGGATEDLAAFTIDVVPSREREKVDAIVRVSAIEHRWIAPEPSPEWLLKLYDEMTLGMSRGSRREIAAACWRLAANDRVHVSGNLGAIAKAFYWPTGCAPRLSPDLLLKDHLARTASQREAGREWIASVPAWMSPEAACNLAYLEQRGGRWMGVGETASNLFFAPVSLFSNRRLFEWICRAPHDAQRGGEMLRRIVRQLRPELDEIPYATGTHAWRRMLPRGLKARLAPLVKGRRA